MADNTLQDWYNNPVYAKARADMQPLIQQVAAEYGVDPAALDYVAGVESKWGSASGLNRPGAAGELGIWQQTPAFVDQYKVNPLDPASGARGAAQALKRYYDKSGSWDMAMLGYNGGEGRLDQVLSGKRTVESLPQITQDYITGARQALGMSQGVRPTGINSYSQPVERTLSKFNLPSGRQMGSSSLQSALASPMTDVSRVPDANLDITGSAQRVPNGQGPVTLGELNRLLGATQRDPRL